MSIAEYITGQRLRVRVPFRDPDGVLTNPVAVSFKVKRPGQAWADETPVNVSTGVYQIELDLDVPGFWRVKVTSSGGVNAAVKTEFPVVE